MSETHDYTDRARGHDVAIQHADGPRIRVSGWGRGVRPGHHLILPNGDRSTRYRVERISYYADPPDMWNADLVFAPRETINEPAQ
jgi:hypothetical protein